jgi:four helix bundle protein
MYDYHRLVVWQKAHSLCLDVVAAMPRGRRAASLISQIVRSAESIPANIVEGRAADSDAEFAKFLKDSFKSANELLYHLELAVARGLITAKVFENFRPRISEVQVLLNAFIRKLVDDDRKGPNRARKD